LDRIDKEKGIGGNRLFYLATAPEFFAGIIENLGAQGMAQPEQGKAAVVIEKPFGHDLDSARELNHQVNAVFHESQVFRIDHYLGKETVQNILVFRFANGIFEPIWNRNYIDHVQITAAETLGVEGRGPFYEKAGALRDVVQNHVMELLSFVAMEPPSSFDAESVRREKVKVWRAIPPIPILNAVRGQYGPGIVEGQHVVGYRDEERVNPESGTETYAAVRLEIENWRWAGVPFYLRAGKRLKKRATEISIQFKQPPLLIFNRMAAAALPGDSAQPAHHSHPAGRGDCAALRRQGADHAEHGRLPGEYGLRLRGGLRQIERQRLRAAAAGRDAGRPDAVSHRDGVEINLGAVYADSGGLGGERSRRSFRTTLPGSWGPECSDHLLERNRG
jgi:glucose-6-phosphate 1-dehydrogenase